MRIRRRTRGGVGSGSKRSIWSLWRLYVFLVVFGAATILGFRWKAFAAIPQPSFDLLYSPQTVQIFLSDPSVPVQLTADLSQSEGRTRETLYLGIRPVRGNLPYFRYVVVVDEGGQGGERVRDYFGELQTHLSNPVTIFQGDTNSLAATQAESSLRSNQGEFYVGSAQLPPVMQLNEGQFYAHLPRIGNDTISLTPVALILQGDPPAYDPKALIDHPQSKATLGFGVYSTDPHDYQLVPSAGNPEAFFVPNALRTTERLDFVSRDLQDYRLESVQPSNGGLVGDDFVWQGGTVLEGTASESNLEAEQFRSNAAFISGIAFATAAAAFIAFVQELPRRRNRPEPTGRGRPGAGRTNTRRAARLRNVGRNPVSRAFSREQLRRIKKSNER